MADFKDLEINPEAGVLSKEELDVLTEVLKSALGPDLGSMAGTFIMDGQADGQDAKCLMQLNLPEGNYSSVMSYAVGTKQCCGITHDSDRLAEASIDAVLAWPKAQVFRSLADLRDKVDRIPTGLYDEGEYLVMVLNADGGRFLMSMQLLCVYESAESEGWARMALHLMAKTCGKMRPGDKILQESLEELDDKIRDLEHFGPMLDELCWMEWTCIEGMFKSLEKPMFRAWREWREKMSAVDEMVKYF